MRHPELRLSYHTSVVANPDGTFTGTVYRVAQWSLLAPPDRIIAIMAKVPTKAAAQRHNRNNLKRRKHADLAGTNFTPYEG